MVENYQVSFNGITVGDGTDFAIDTLTGLEDIEARIEEYEKANASGSYVYSGDQRALYILMAGHMLADTEADFEDDLDAFKEAFAITDDPVAFEWKRGNSHTAQSVGATLRKRSLPFDPDTGKQVNAWAVDLIAEDPTIAEGS